MGQELFVLGITARAGEYRWSGKQTKTITPPPVHALEAELDGTTFFNSARLAQAGTVPSGLDMHDYNSADWSKAFDGVLVLDAEYAPHSTRFQ